MSPTSLYEGRCPCARLHSRLHTSYLHSLVSATERTLLTGAVFYATDQWLQLAMTLFYFSHSMLCALHYYRYLIPLAISYTNTLKVCAARHLIRGLQNPSLSFDTCL